MRCFRFTALVFTTLIGLAHFVAVAQTTDQLTAQDQQLGPGCNEIGIGIPTQNTPLTATAEWWDEHTACDNAPGDPLRVGGYCMRTTDGSDDTALCAVMVLDGARSTPIGCDDFNLSTDNGPYGVDAQFTNVAVSTLKEAAQAQNLTSMDNATPCTTPMPFSRGNIIVAGFHIKPTSAPVALTFGVAQGRRLAIIVTEPPINIAQ